MFDEGQREYANLSLFPDDREIPTDAVDSLQVKLSGLELRSPRLFGSCWLACELWRQLGLPEFWEARLAGSREEVPWEKVLQLLVVNRLLDPTSEFRVHRQWYLTTAMDALLGTDFAVAEKDDSAPLHPACSRYQATDREAEIAKLQLPSQPPPRLVAQKESKEIEVQIV